MTVDRKIRKPAPWEEDDEVVVVVVSMVVVVVAIDLLR